jgi:hypothetical protein
VGLGFGTLIALFVLIAPGAIVGRIAQLTWPVAVAVAAPLTYGVVALAIIPYGALGIPWNGWTALVALAAVCLLTAALQLVFARYRDSCAEAQGIRGLPALTVAAGVLLGVLLVSWAAWRGLVHWQSIPSTWDAVWHANTVRFILDTGQASSTHMGELRNVETHAQLYYPSVFHAVTASIAGLRRLTDRVRPLPAPVWIAATAVVLAVATVFSGRHYLYRHLVLFGDKYDSVMVNQQDLDAMAYLATLPDAKNTIIGDSNVDGTAWMYAVADLHPLWTHYDFPQQTGPGFFRYAFWERANTGNPWVVEAVRVFNIRYILTSEPTVRGFKEPEGIRSLEKSKSWAKIYDNGGAQIWEWRGNAAAAHS